MSDEVMRLQKFLSRAGVASRRSSEGLILQGRVRVNGERVTELGTKVDPHSDQVEIDGARVTLDAPRWIMLHKPAGVVTTLRDPQRRTTVYSLLKDEDRSLSYVGRLDQETEGLLLFTNEGEILHLLTHPSSEITREYRVGVVGVPSRETIATLAGGIELDDGPARPENVRLVKIVGSGKGAILALTLREGRKREVRRMIEAVGHSVHRLRRVGFGPLRLEGVGVGEWRELRPDEIRALRAAVGRTEGGQGHHRRVRKGGRGGRPD